MAYVSAFVFEDQNCCHRSETGGDLGDSKISSIVVRLVDLRVRLAIHGLPVHDAQSSRLDMKPFYENNTDCEKVGN